jgi:putative protease
VLFRSSAFVGVALGYEDGYAIVEQRNNFKSGEAIEIFKRKGSNMLIESIELFGMDMRPLDCAPHPLQKVKVKVSGPVERMDILRRPVVQGAKAKSE